MKCHNLESNIGLTLVEILVATSIILVFLLALSGVNNLYFKTVLLNTSSVRATFLAEEGLEAMRFLRDSSWINNISPLTINTGYNLVLEANTWKATTTSILIDNLFERVVNIREVYRDSSDDIVSSGGTLDPNTRFITVTVSWRTGEATTTKLISTYLSNIIDE